MGNPDLNIDNLFFMTGQEVEKIYFGDEDVLVCDRQKRIYAVIDTNLKSVWFAIMENGKVVSKWNGDQVQGVIFK